MVCSQLRAFLVKSQPLDCFQKSKQKDFKKTLVLINFSQKNSLKPPNDHLADLKSATSRYCVKFSNSSRYLNHCYSFTLCGAIGTTLLDLGWLPMPFKVIIIIALSPLLATIIRLGKVKKCKIVQNILKDLYELHTFTWKWFAANRMQTLEFLLYCKKCFFNKRATVSRSCVNPFWTHPLCRTTPNKEWPHSLNHLSPSQITCPR